MRNIPGAARPSIRAIYLDADRATFIAAFDAIDRVPFQVAVHGAQDAAGRAAHWGTYDAVKEALSHIIPKI